MLIVLAVDVLGAASDYGWSVTGLERTSPEQKPCMCIENGYPNQVLPLGVSVGSKIAGLAWQSCAKQE